MLLSFRCLIGQLDDSQSDVIKFGTNADLSEATKFAESTLDIVKQGLIFLLTRWGLQLAELQKLPEFTKVHAVIILLTAPVHEDLCGVCRCLRN
jgi:hypothetical protein